MVSGLKCRSFREVFIVLVALCLLSLYVSYQLGSLQLSQRLSQESLLWEKPGKLGAASPRQDGRQMDKRAKAQVKSKIQDLLLQIENQYVQSLKRVSRIALILGQRGVVFRELSLYQEVLVKHQFTVSSPTAHLPLPGENQTQSITLDEIFANDPLLRNRASYSSWLLLLCTTIKDGYQGPCLTKDSYSKFLPYQKVNRIPGLENILLKKDAFCNTFRKGRELIAGVRQSFLSPPCFALPSQAALFASNLTVFGDDVHWVLKPLDVHHGDPSPEIINPISSLAKNMLQQFTNSRPSIVQQYFGNPLLVFGSPVSVQFYVLVTSVMPLRVHMFHKGLVQFRHNHHMGFKKIRLRTWLTSHLWQFVERNHGPETVHMAITNAQNAIVKSLLLAESLLPEYLHEIPSTDPNRSYRCEHCYQLLCFDMIFNSSFHPVIMEVDGQPSMFEVGNEGNPTFAGVKAAVIDGLLEMIFSTRSVATDLVKGLDSSEVNAGMIGADCLLSHDLCLSRDDLRYLLDWRRESTEPGGFMQIYPGQDLESYTEFLKEIQESSLGHRVEDFEEESVEKLNTRPNTANMHKILTTLKSINSDVWTNTALWNFTEPWAAQKGDSNVHNTGRFIQGQGSSNQNIEGRRPKCSDEDSTVMHLQSIHIEPALELTPTFSPFITEYFADVPYDQLMIKVWAFAQNCQSEARLDEKLGTSQPANYTLGLGENKVTFVVVNLHHSVPWVINSYTVTVYRPSSSETEIPFPLDIKHDVCSLKQECELKISANEQCGLQKESFENWIKFSMHVNSLAFCDEGDAQGSWVLPCKSCDDRTSCLWSHAVWSPLTCRHGRVPRDLLSKCLAGKKLLFIGDSTNRGIMHYAVERLNGTLTEWDKTHHLRVYTNINAGLTPVSFAYYPQFWLPIPQRPVFEKALHQLIQKSRPLANDTSTILMVGGVQWLATQHLHMLLRVLKREGLEGIKLAIKTLGSGFHMPVEGVHTLSKTAQQKLLLHSMGLADFAKNYNFEVIDTYNMTVSRYKDFLQGKCACHFHRVVNAPEPMTATPSWPSLSSSLPKGGASKVGRFRVEGDINAAYSEILLSRLCSHFRE